MRVMRAEPGRFADVAARAAGAFWRSYDLQLTTYAGLLALIGLVMAYTNSVEAGEPVFVTGTIFTRALMWTTIASLVFVAATAIDYRWLRTFAWPLYAVNIGLLVVTITLGSGVGNTSRWVTLGPLTFQFSELAKILMTIVLAAYLGNRDGRLDSLPEILGACLLAIPPWILVLFQPDLGTSLVLLAILAGTLFMSGASIRWLAVLAGGVLAALPLAWNHLLVPYQKERVLSFLDPTADALGAGWQVSQAQIAISSGGLLGTGLTNGSLGRSGVLPVQESDFVFAVLAQELGFLGAAVVFLLFAALIWRILTVAWRSRDPFGTLYATGIASILLFQCFVNVGMVMGILPVTGIPLPFITHGGSSLVTTAIGLGFVQSIAIRQHRAQW